MIYDFYGFPTKVSQESFMKLATVELPRKLKQESIWFDYINSISGTENLKINGNKHFKKLVRSGIPDKERSHIWCKILGVYEKTKEKPKNFFKDALLSSSSSIDPEIMEQIMLDVPRTFSGAISFSPGSVLNVLKVFAVLHPEIGYCQSLSFIAAVLLSVIKEEEPSFWALTILIEKYFPKLYFDPTMFDFSVDLCLVKMLIEERTPELHKVSSTLNYDWIQCSSGWLLTLFSNSFPIPTVLRIWDSLFLEGPKIVFRVIVAFLRLNEELIKGCKDQNDVPKLMKDMEINMVEADKLMEIAFGIKMFSRNHLKEMRDVARRNVEEKGLEGQPKMRACLQSMFGQFKL